MHGFHGLGVLPLEPRSDIVRGVVGAVGNDGDAGGFGAVREVAEAVDAAFSGGHDQFDERADAGLVGVVVGELVEGAVVPFIPGDGGVGDGGEDLAVAGFGIVPENEAGAAADDERCREWGEVFRLRERGIEDPCEGLAGAVADEDEAESTFVAGALDEGFAIPEGEIRGRRLFEGEKVEQDGF